VKDLYFNLAEILEVVEVQPNDVLKEFENWDSLTVLSILAMLGARYGINLTARDLNQTTTSADLAALVANRMAK
jgi:acyl carrier protein